MKQKSTADLRIIGRTERVDFPDWELFDLAAKVDTGAYTSSLHCHHIERRGTKGHQKVRFNLLDPTHEAYDEKRFELPVFDVRDVRSSNGQVQRRIIVQAHIRMFGESMPIELSLTDRSEMRYPILLGRKFLQHRFIVDVAKVNQSKKSTKKKSHS